MSTVRSSGCASNPEREKNPYLWHTSPVLCTCSISSFLLISVYSRQLTQKKSKSMS